MQLAYCHGADALVQQLTDGRYSIALDSDGLYLVDNAGSQRVLLAKTKEANRERVAQVERLSERERTVFASLGRGAEMSEIAASMNVSVKTVETYRARIKQKLGIKNRVELLRFAVECELLHGCATPVEADGVPGA